MSQASPHNLDAERVINYTSLAALDTVGKFVSEFDCTESCFWRPSDALEAIGVCTKLSACSERCGTKSVLICERQP